MSETIYELLVPGIAAAIFVGIVLSFFEKSSVEARITALVICGIIIIAGVLIYSGKQKPSSAPIENPPVNTPSLDTADEPPLSSVENFTPPEDSPETSQTPTAVKRNRIDRIAARLYELDKKLVKHKLVAIIFDVLMLFFISILGGCIYAVYQWAQKAVPILLLSPVIILSIGGVGVLTVAPYINALNDVLGENWGTVFGIICMLWCLLMLTGNKQ